jgi:putative lipoprotein
MRAGDVCRTAGILTLAAGLALVGGVSCVAEPRTRVTGTVTYRERVALPPDAVADITLEDVSRQDAPSVVISRQTLDPAPAVPIAFELAYEPAAIEERHSYAVRATIRHGHIPLFVTDRAYPVLTRGHPTKVDLLLMRSGGGSAPMADANLVGTRWRLRTLHGARVTPGKRPPFFQLSEESDGTRVFGSGGCNTLRGPCELGSDTLGFGQLATTRMACPEPEMELETGFLRALESMKGYEIQGTWLILSGEDGELATLEAWYE